MSVRACTAVFFLLAACQTDTSADRYAQDQETVDLRSYAADSPESTLIVRAANEATFEELDITAGLDRRAAEGLVANRPYASLDDVDRIAYVGSKALDQLYQFATEAYGVSDVEPEQGVLVHGVEEGSPLAVGMLLLANTASQSDLDDTIGLDARAAQAITDYRPVTSLASLDAVPWVGASAFGRLAEQAEVVDVATDCAPGTIRTNQGAIYDDLEDAVFYSAPGAVLDLCEGLYQVDNLETNRDITIVGHGSVTIEVYDSVLLGDGRGDVTAHLQNLTIEAYSFENTGEAVFDGVVLTVEEWSTFYNDAEVRNSTFAGPYQVRGGTLVSTDSWYHGTASYALDLTGGDLEMVGGGITECTGIGLYVGTRSTARLQNVDFGVGATENNAGDINTVEGEIITWLTADTNLFCTGNGCVAL